MILNILYEWSHFQNSIKIYETTPNTENIEQFLEKEKLLNITKPWNKLNKFSKMQKLNQYCKEYGEAKEFYYYSLIVTVVHHKIKNHRMFGCLLFYSQYRL